MVYFLIDDELLEYSNNPMSASDVIDTDQSDRGLEGTSIADHAVDTKAYLIDHIITLSSRTLVTPINRGFCKKRL